VSKRSLKQVLQEVDPNLTVISGHHRKGKSVNEQDWLASTGVICKQCGREVQQSRDGLCLPCWEKQEESKVEVRDKTGALNFFGDNILAQITHQSRKTKD
jgi:predicted amidophosphoribosyltransferase